MSEAVFVQELTKAYNGRMIVDYLNLSVKSGTVFGLLGANGADYTFLEQSFGAVGAVAICAGGLMWLPPKYKKPNTSTYVQGVEAEPDYTGVIPEGFDTIRLPEAEYLMCP